MQLDYGRQKDLEELYSDYQKERTPHRKQQIEKIMSGILAESKASRLLRDELIRATRSGDRYHLAYCREELRRIQAEKYNNNIKL